MEIPGDLGQLKAKLGQLLHGELEQGLVVSLEVDLTAHFQHLTVQLQEVAVSQAALGMALAGPGIAEVDVDPVHLTGGEELGELVGVGVHAIILSFSPKFDALVNSIPSAIVGGVSFILYGMISAVGVRNIVENQVDLTKSRNLIIAAVMFVSGLGFSSVGGVTFTVGGAAVTLSGLAIAALCGVILNAILPGNDYEFGISVEGDKSADLGSY